MFCRIITGLNQATLSELENLEWNLVGKLCNRAWLKEHQLREWPSSPLRLNYGHGRSAFIWSWKRLNLIACLRGPTFPSLCLTFFRVPCEFFDLAYLSGFIIALAYCVPILFYSVFIIDTLVISSPFFVIIYNVNLWENSNWKLYLPNCQFMAGSDFDWRFI